MLGHFSFRSNSFHRSDDGNVNSAEVFRDSAEVPSRTNCPLLQKRFLPMSAYKTRGFSRELLGFLAWGFQTVHTLEVAGSNPAAAT